MKKRKIIILTCLICIFNVLIINGNNRQEQKVMEKSIDELAVYIHQYGCSELHWEEQGIILQQTATISDQKISARFVIETEGPVQLPLKFRYPAEGKTLSVRINTKEISVDAIPDSYIILNRTWQDMDKIEIEIEIKLDTE